MRSPLSQTKESKETLRVALPFSRGFYGSDTEFYVTGQIELGYNYFQCDEEQTLLYSFKSPSLRHILRVSLFPTLISVVNTCTMCK